MRLCNKLEEQALGVIDTWQWQSSSMAAQVQGWRSCFLHVAAFAFTAVPAPQHRTRGLC
jgi:hypothetical protein